MQTPRAAQLRETIGSLPVSLRTTMLDRLGRTRIIAGADDDSLGGRCPILAADPEATPTRQPEALAFARAWDRYTGAGRKGRPASDREVRTLRTMLETSLELDAGVESELASAISEHRRLRARGRFADLPESQLAEAIAEHQALQARAHAAIRAGRPLFDVEVPVPEGFEPERALESTVEPTVDTLAPVPAPAHCAPRRTPFLRGRKGCSTPVAPRPGPTKVGTPSPRLGHRSRSPLLGA